MASNQVANESFNYNGIAHRFTRAVVKSDLSTDNWPEPRQIEVYDTGTITVIDTGGNETAIPIVAVPQLLLGLYVRVKTTGTDIADANIVSYHS